MKMCIRDSYNIIFSWDELNELAKINIDSARGKLLDILCDYQGSRGIEVIAVFDAYRVQGHRTEVTDYHNIHVVFTKEAETADPVSYTHLVRKRRTYCGTQAGRGAGASFLRR